MRQTGKPHSLSFCVTVPVAGPQECGVSPTASHTPGILGFSGFPSIAPIENAGGSGGE